MRSVVTRRAARVAGIAAVAAVALAGCSSGQVAETALKKSSVPGVNVETADRSVAIRNLHVAYNGPEGYQAGDSAPLEVSLVNQTETPISVSISSRPPAGAADPKLGIVSAQRVGLSGGSSSGAATPSADPEPSGSRPVATPDTDTPENIPAPSSSASGEPAPSAAPPATATLQPARISIPPMSSAIYLVGDAEQLVAAGLSGRLLPAQSVNLVFEFSNGAAPLELQAPVTVPLSPAPRGSAENEGVGEDEGNIE